MPNIKSAKKRMILAERNRIRNQSYKSAIRTSMKRVLESLRQKSDIKEAEAYLAKAYSLIDRAVLKGILHKNTGARYKSRITAAVNKNRVA